MCVRKKKCSTTTKMMRACHKDIGINLKRLPWPNLVNLNTRVIKHSNYKPLRRSRNSWVSNDNKQILREEERVLPYNGMPNAVSCRGGRKIVILQLL